MRGNHQLIKRVSLVFTIVAVVVTAVLICANHNWSPIKAGAKADHILVEKAARRLTLFSGADPIKSYTIALGRSPTGHKLEEDDNRTPEGIYFIDGRNSDSACHLALHVSYPQAGDKAAAKKRGVSPGGDIMVHGIQNGYGWLGALHRSGDWTAGCMAVTDFEIDEIWRTVPNGTKIEIRP